MRSMHFKLFWRYAALIFTILSACGILLYYIWGNEFQSKAEEELQADCDNICTLLDTQMEQVDELSKRILNSEEIQKLFLEDNYSKGPEAYYHRREFSEKLFEIIRLSFDHMELNMFDDSGRYVFVGDISKFEYRDPSEFRSVPWISDTLGAYGKKVLLPTRLPELNDAGEPVLSLCRAFAPENPRKETAVLELQLNYSYLCGKITNAIHNQQEEKKVFVYQQDGQRIYPYEHVSEQADDAVRAYLQSTEKEKGEPYNTIKKQGESAVFAAKTSPFTGWTVFVAENEKDLFASFYQFRQWIFWGCILVLVLVMVVTNRIAVSLSTPIQKLENTICSLDLDHLEELELPEYKNNVRELDSLYHSFAEMKTNLENSLQSAVAARTIAVDAQMLALQSQMNPHFLYNTLASISVLAEDGQNDKVVKICDDLSLMLRYVSSSVSRSVPFQQELKHTQCYMNLIKIKYEERIQFTLEIEEDMLSVPVPKLIVQPLVENCVKYGLEVEPPWRIKIAGYIENDVWNIVVRDNGTGFDEKYLQIFQKEADKISRSKNKIPMLEINGMGLLNLYTRLQLLYGEKMIFEIGNDPEGGAKIRIGGGLSSDVSQEDQNTGC